MISVGQYAVAQGDALPGFARQLTAWQLTPKQSKARPGAAGQSMGPKGQDGATARGWQTVKRRTQAERAHAHRVAEGLTNWASEWGPGPAADSLHAAAAQWLEKSRCDCGAAFGVDHDCPVLPSCDGEEMMGTEPER